MTDEYAEVPEVVGKVVKYLKPYRSDPDGTELLIDFIDGTSFSCNLENKPSIRATLIWAGIGTPGVLREYLV
jgi:hypothetical protein